MGNDHRLFAAKIRQNQRAGFFLICYASIFEFQKKAQELLAASKAEPEKVSSEDSRKSKAVKKEKKEPEKLTTSKADEEVIYKFITLWKKLFHYFKVVVSFLKKLISRPFLSQVFLTSQMLTNLMRNLEMKFLKMKTYSRMKRGEILYLTTTIWILKRAGTWRTSSWEVILMKSRKLKWSRREGDW